MIALSRAMPWLAGMLFAAAAVVCVPKAIDAGHLLAIEDEPAAIADRALAQSFDADVATREIEAALAAHDPDLAASFLALAGDRGVAVPAALAERVAAEVARANSAAAHTAGFARGFVTGEPTDAVELAGTAVGDLLVFGDIRDAVREGSRYVAGRPTDERVLGLALVGLAVTAATYASVGATVPVRVGVSVAKAVRKTGWLGVRLANWFGRETVKVEKAKALTRVMGDLGRVQTRAGTRAAVDAVKIARGPREVARIARLAEQKGGQTRAILKLLGRGALWLSIAAFNIAWWLFGAILTVFGLLSSVKRGAERMTQRYLDRRKLRVLRARLAASEAAA